MELEHIQEREVNKKGKNLPFFSPSKTAVNESLTRAERFCRRAAASAGKVRICRNEVSEEAGFPQGCSTTRAHLLSFPTRRRDLL